jgi:glycosyltransferase involved in cell wall biosynthesis
MFYTWNPFLQWHLRDIPSVVAVHDPISHAGLADAAYRLLENISIRRAERCIVFSQALAPELSRRGADPQHIDYVPLGELSYYRRYLPGTPRQRSGEISKLLFFGRITAYKGLEVLLRAYKQLSETCQVELMVVGEGNLAPYKPLLDEVPQVRLINRWVDEKDIAGIFQQADVVVLPYTAGSQSGVVPIAASFGLPVIATRVGGIPEQIEHGTTGLLVEPGSVTELAAAVQRLMDDPPFSRQMGENLQLEYRKNKSWKEISGRIFDACERAANQDLIKS